MAMVMTEKKGLIFFDNNNNNIIIIIIILKTSFSGFSFRTKDLKTNRWTTNLF